MYALHNALSLAMGHLTMTQHCRTYLKNAAAGYFMAILCVAVVVHWCHPCRNTHYHSSRQQIVARTLFQPPFNGRDIFKVLIRLL